MVAVADLQKQLVTDGASSWGFVHPWISGNASLPDFTFRESVAG
jgi:hypothetical protein